MQGKCRGLVHAPVVCSTVVQNASDTNNDTQPQQKLETSCDGETYSSAQAAQKGDAVMILAKNAALKRMVEYGLWHGEASASAAAAAEDDIPECRMYDNCPNSTTSEPSTLENLAPPSATYSSARMLTNDSSIVVTSIRKGSGGLGNVIYSMIVGLTVAAYSNTKRIYATSYSDEAWKRYGGLYSAALEDSFLDNRQHSCRHPRAQHCCRSCMRCPRPPPYGAPQVPEGNFWPLSFFKYATAEGDHISKEWIEAPLAHTMVCSPWSDYHALALIVTQPIFPAVTLLSHGAGAVISEEMGDMLVTFMSHFLMSPAPALRMEIESIVKTMRSTDVDEPLPFLIGIHMRWVHENHATFQSTFHAQYTGRVGFTSADFDAFVDAAQVLADGHERVVFYIASDSLYRLLNLREALSRPERGWSVVTANVLTNVSDGPTADSIIDLFVLSMCDDLIATHTSTFSHVAAALGGHRPVLISAELSFTFGRRSLRRSRSLDWTMPTQKWETFLPDLPYESWISGGMSYGAMNAAVKCQGLSEQAVQAAVHQCASFFVELDKET
jgi:hypothetical protein